LFIYGTPGSLPGEGAAYFLLSGQPSASGYGCIRAVKTLYKPGDPHEVQKLITGFLAEQDMKVSQVDAVTMGMNGDILFDPVYEAIGYGLFRHTLRLGYKHLCGEYNTSGGFAIWLAANILRHQTVPEAVRDNDVTPGEYRHILIYNQYRNINHSLILVSACR
jgi:hypothetical protein